MGKGGGVLCVKRLTERFDIPAGVLAWILEVLSPRIFSCAQPATMDDGEQGLHDQTTLRPDSIRPLGTHQCVDLALLTVSISKHPVGLSLVHRS